MTGWVSPVWQQPSAVLLAVQLLGVLLYPFMDESPVGRAALSLFALVVLFLAVRAVRATPALTWVAVGIGLPLIALTILEVADPLNGQVVLASSILHAVFYFYTTFALIRYMFLDRFVTTDEIWAVGATFTVVAWAFAYMFMAVQVIWPGSFTAAIAAGRAADLVRAFVPVLHEPDERWAVRHHAVLPHARSWVMIEQVAGLMYVALVVSRVVGLTICDSGCVSPVSTVGRPQRDRHQRPALRWVGAFATAPQARLRCVQSQRRVDAPVSPVSCGFSVRRVRRARRASIRGVSRPP